MSFSIQRFPLAALAPVEANNDPPSEALVAISKLKEGRDGHPPLTIPQRLCGRVMNVVVWENSHWNQVAPHLNIGDFVRLRNVKESFFPEIGIRCLHVASKSWLTPMPANTFEVADLLAAHSKRVQNNHPINPKSGVLPLDMSSIRDNGDDPDSEKGVAHKDLNANDGAAITCSSLSELVGGRPGTEFIGDVCVATTQPAVKEAAGMGNLCPVVNGSEPRAYRFALCLTDGDDSVMALVSDSVGAQFFGMSAEEASGNRAHKAYEVLSCIAHRQLFRVEVENIEMGGKTFFLLNSISLQQETVMEEGN